MLGVQTEKKGSFLTHSRVCARVQQCVPGGERTTFGSWCLPSMRAFLFFLLQHATADRSAGTRESRCRKACLQNHLLLIPLGPHSVPGERGYMSSTVQTRLQSKRTFFGFSLTFSLFMCPTFSNLHSKKSFKVILRSLKGL